MIPLASDGELNCLNGNFLSGVVEGFYGRPWTTDQRKILFKRMQKMGLNTYLYAPKDDCKHRMYWRDLYSVEEADHLTSLIEAASESGVSFIYALSPGLDIGYSNTKEITFLKRKLEQVASFGCKCFALLFDDIDADMCEADKEMFQSTAQAQVSVSNEVYQHLNQPRFLFCPTEYCASRALPSVSSSEYLKTIGSKLLPDIDIMWTGPKVVSKHITIKSIEEVSQLLQRPPVIWDNIHANDYDQKRLFLGPYDGRSSELIPYLRGVLTNPNCEFEANYVALHTLSQWSKSNAAGVRRDITTETVVNADIRLETDGEYSSQDDCAGHFHRYYQPRHALSVAINDWIAEFYVENRPPSHKLMPIPAPMIVPTIVPTCATTTPTTSTGTLASVIPIKNVNEVELLNESYMQPIMNPVNSLVAPVLSSSDSDSDSAVELEPMDCVVTPGSTPVSTHIHIACTELLDIKPDCFHKVESSSDMQIDSETTGCLDCAKTKLPSPSSAPMLAEPADSSPLLGSCSPSKLLTHDDILLLVEMFYLPFEHGSSAVDMLSEFDWLKRQCHTVYAAKAKDATESVLVAATEWQERAKAFQLTVSNVCSMMDHVCSVPNTSLVCELFPYVIDLKGVLAILTSYIQWLACGPQPAAEAFIQGPCTWSNPMYRESFAGGEQEPWVFRGGLQAEFQRLLLLDGAADLMTPVFPLEPVTTMCGIRPYSPMDEESVYEVCRKTCDDGLDGTEIFPEQPDLIGDKLVGAFLTSNPQYCFTIEGEDGVCGYVLAALDAKDCASRADIAWFPAMQEKYPKPEKMEGLSPAEEMICSFHAERIPMPADVYTVYPSVLRMDVLKERCAEPNAPRRALACTIAALKANGSCGIHVEIAVGDKNTHNFYTKLGFFDVPTGSVQEDITIMGRVI